MAEPAGPLVSAEWLLANLARPGLVVLDARIGAVTEIGGKIQYLSGRPAFEQDGHILGAQFADLNNEFSDPQGSFLFSRPQALAFAAVTKRLGIDAGSLVVVYDPLSGAWAARVWWVLRAFGHPHVFVLDGGLARFVAAGGALAFGAAAQVAPGDFTPAPQDGYFVDRADVEAMVHSGEGLLICATQRAEFTGAGSSDARRGHIPGSLNVPYREVLDEAGKIDVARVRALVPVSAGPVLYCGGAINAAGLALAMEAANYEPPAIYDGSPQRMAG